MRTDVQLDVTGLGNALVDSLVTIEDDGFLSDLGLVRGMMHPVGHDEWMSAYELVRHKKVVFEPGGSCANTIGTIGYLGGKATYCGQVGNDQMGHMYARKMEVACERHSLVFGDSEPTGKCLSIISALDAERTMITDLGAAITLPALGAFEQELTQTKIAHFTGYTLLGPPMLDHVMKAMAIAKEAGALIALDLADPFVISAIRGNLIEVMKTYTDIVFLNAEEANMLVGGEGQATAQDVANLTGVSTVIVKLGSQGSQILHQGRLFAIDAFPVEAVDTTGAGDSYAGGFLYGYSQGWPIARCGELASRIASLTVQQVGAVVRDRSMITKAMQIVQRLVS